jgi:hypothetical protein
MGLLTLDDPVLGKLGGGQYRTVPFRMNGEFRDLQLRWYQSSASQDMEPHYLEIFMESHGVDESLPT